ncbi:MAG TPA: hypothetical protein VFA46_03995 [Actinomycetes bacterium]|nr:hypothetical protein [Actinomycetes bacterium]
MSRRVVWLGAVVGAVALLAGCSSAPSGGHGAGMSGNGGTMHGGGMGGGMMGGGDQTSSAPASVPPNAQRVQLVVNPPPLGGVRNPAGEVVDGFVPATFRMQVGVPVAVTVLNYDDMPHTWTSAPLGVDAAVPAGSARSPSTTTFVIDPRAAGTFAWRCMTPCDAWAMAHDGYMRGTVTVAA